MDVGSSIIYHLERHVNACLTCFALRHGTQGFDVETTESLGVAGFSYDITETLIGRLREYSKENWTGRDTPCSIDHTVYDLKIDNFDFSQLPKWLLVIVTENDLSVQENITAICRWCRRVWSWQCDCLVVALGSTSPPSKSHGQGLIRNKIVDLCKRNPELQELRQNHRLRTFHLPHWDSIENIEPEFVGLVKEWLNDVPNLTTARERSEKEHLTYSDISKMIIRDLRHSMPNLDIFFRLLLMCILGCVSVAVTLLMIVSVSKGGGLDYDIKKAQEYLVSHLESRRTGKSEWGRTHSAGILTSLQINNPHWCFETVENQRSVDRLEIGILSLLSRLSSKSVIVPAFTPLRLTHDINALLATFQNPRDFHEHDLVAILKRYVTDVIPYTSYTAHAYSSYVIALCNSGISLKNEHAQRILKKKNKDGSFSLGINEAAVSLLALSCVEGTENQMSEIETIVNYIRYQRRHEGSYGSLYTTALVLQVFSIHGLSVDTPIRREATLSWLARNCYANTALKDPIVASTVLLALSGKNYLDILPLIGARKKQSEHISTGFGKSDKFRYLKPDNLDIHAKPDIISVNKGVQQTEGQINKGVQQTKGHINKGVLQTEEQVHQKTHTNLDEVLNHSKQNQHHEGEQSDMGSSHRQEVDKTLPSLTEESVAMERHSQGIPVNDKRQEITTDHTGKSTEHRWKKWKKTASYFDESDLEADDIHISSHVRHESHSKHAPNTDYWKSKSTFNERTLVNIFLGRCDV